VLVPNVHGLERAVQAGADHVAVFTAASDAFNRKNINCDIAASLLRLKPVIEGALARGLPLRGYVSCALGCPYQGEVAVADVVRVSVALAQMGVEEISLGDTIGVGTPGKARAMLRAVAAEVPMERIAVHFHDTRGQALANVFACLEEGVRSVDASVAGLGGCPYARGATGNLATEDLVYMLEGLGMATGVDLDALVETGRWMSNKLGREPASKLGRVKKS
jgi:hydroxymethylglutaryl-CoA lyase